MSPDTRDDKSDDDRSPRGPRRGPRLFELDEGEARPGPDSAPPVPDPVAPAPEGRAMQTVATLAARRPSRLARWFWSLLVTLIGVVISVAAWSFVTGLIAQVPLLGLAVAVLFAAFVLVLLAIAVKEIAAFSRLARMDRLHEEAVATLAEADLGRARKLVKQLEGVFGHRPELTLARETLARQGPEQFDAAALLGLTEAQLMAPLDAAARREVEAAARQVATVTALLPLALADVVTALTANLRMIRRIAEIYGGRSGTLGSLRLTRAVMTHLVATGAVAVGDDLIGSVAGGHLLTKLSRRFGEGVVNGALTARVGIAAMEVCRPLPFDRLRKPRVTNVLQRALTGLFDRET
ncbi:YcjF family protein [Maritimibacter alkaliphilus]|uniref:YcjF family protein n=1 Tax=Maritimibacter alkaliphilus TaxID=404236 RepID=UPI001C98DE8C|nr:TIGR01620 family protein [Maritimibacter alkaliphilus]MBY6092061.1 YcjF family protein [Maritimibacter alkaliphilus]